MRRAKIVCTLGPASNDLDTIIRLVEAGMDVARLNFSHGSHDDHRQVYARVREAADTVGRPVAILQDLQGPKIRVGTFPNGPVLLEGGKRFTLSTKPVDGDEKQVFVNYEPLASDVREGELIMINDGLIQLRVVKTTKDAVHTVVEVGGMISDRKGLNLPDTRISLPSLTPKDKGDLPLGIELGVDFIALSFVRSGLDLHQLRAMLPDGPDRPHLISKIEKPQAVANLVEIVSASDGVMIARGDLGVEMAPRRSRASEAHHPAVQRAAEVLDHGDADVGVDDREPSPDTRGGVRRRERGVRRHGRGDALRRDGGRKVPDRGGDLHGPHHPRGGAEPYRDVMATTLERSTHVRSSSTAVAHAAVAAAEEVQAKVIACFTLSGSTPRLIKALAPKQRILAFTPVEGMWRKMAAYRAVTPVQVEMKYDPESLFKTVEDELRRTGTARSGDHAVIVMGTPPARGPARTSSRCTRSHSDPARYIVTLRVMRPDWVLRSFSA